MSYAGLGQVYPGGRGNSNDSSPTRGNSNDRSPTRTEVRSPTSTSTSTEVRSPTSTSTDAYTRGNVTVTGGAGAGATTSVRVYQGRPGDFPERTGRAAGRTQERIVNDSVRGLMAPRPSGLPIPLQPSTTQKVGLVGLGGYEGPALRRRGYGQGLMGLGAAVDDQAPVKLGTQATTDPILSSASVMASSIMLRLAAVPKTKRLDEMVAIMNAGQPGLGAIVKADYVRRAQTAGSSQKDQAMFDALRAAIANVLASRTLALAPMSGFGQVSQGVQDANSLFCSYGAGTASMVSGLLAQFNTGGSSSTAGITGAQSAGAIAGCNIPALQAQGQLALQQAQLAQSATAQTIALQQAGDTRFLQYALAGGALIGVLAIGAAILKK